MIIDKCVDLINVHQRVDQQTVSIHSGRSYITIMLVHYIICVPQKGTWKYYNICHIHETYNCTKGTFRL